MYKILITGGTGMLGKSLKKFLPKADFLMGREELDLADPGAAEQIKAMSHYDLIVHTAALTSMNANEANPMAALQLHSNVVPFLQERCSKLVYISAQGKDHKGVYFQTKLTGEQKVFRRKEDLVIRTNIFGNGGLCEWAISSLERKARIKGYKNVLFNPVHVDQLSNFIANSALSYQGILSIGSNRTISKYEFLVELADWKSLDKSLISAVDIEGVTDLTVDLGKHSIEMNLTSGIELL